MEKGKLLIYRREKNTVLSCLVTVQIPFCNVQLPRRPCTNLRTNPLVRFKNILFTGTEIPHVGDGRSLGIITARAKPLKTQFVL